jgi:hypothetical protein
VDRTRLTVAVAMALAALLFVLPGIDAHGFWFDEAYTARIAALPLPRLLSAAAQDIHPPGWPLLEALSAATGLPDEVALRLPSAVSFAVLVGVLAFRTPVAAGALLAYAPLAEQATQARPYVAMALGLVATARLAEGGRWGVAGVVAGLTAALHALGALLAAAVVVGTAFAVRPRFRDGAAFLGAATALTVPWLPSFVASAGGYLAHPWYGRATLADAWILCDGGGAVVAAVALFATRRELRPFLPALLVGAALAALNVAGVGVEIRKTGLTLLPLAIAAARDDRRAGAIACGALVFLAADLPVRPDLREAHAAVAAIGREVPVVSVFASEAAWYFRDPAPLASYREPEAIARRVAEVLDSDGASCVVSIALPGTFPTDGVRTVAVADVTGLDVRIVGDRCDLQPPPPWQSP